MIKNIIITEKHLKEGRKDYYFDCALTLAIREQIREFKNFLVQDFQISFFDGIKWISLKNESKVEEFVDRLLDNDISSIKPNLNLSFDFDNKLVKYIGY